MLMYKSDIAEQAERHTEEMEQKYAEEIKWCRDNTICYTGVNGYHDFKGYNDHNKAITYHPVTSSNNAPRLIQATTTDALEYITDHDDKAHVILLNFASYKNAGGAFLGGSMAQEEALCHESFLYNVLREFPEYYEENGKHLNKGLYLDRALYTPSVFFNHNGKQRCADVITCACPNKTPLVRYNAFTETENHEALKDRITFLRDILTLEWRVRCHSVTPYVVLGAWGCGIFRQDAKEVAELFKKIFKETDLNIVYAIPDDRNFKAFEEVFGKDKVIETDRTDKEYEDIKPLNIMAPSIR